MAIIEEYKIGNTAEISALLKRERRTTPPRTMESEVNIMETWRIVAITLAMISIALSLLSLGYSVCGNRKTK